MKKIYIILFIIIFSIGFKAGDYDSDGRYKYLPKKIADHQIDFVIALNLDGWKIKVLQS